jgi:membrane protease YdiL (CAAX protease family)
MLWSCLLVSRKYGTASLRRDLGLGIRRRDVWLGVVVAVVGTALSATASAVFSGTSLGGSNTQVIAGQRHNGAGAVLITLVVALGAPIFEELFFRGLIRTALSARLGPARAILAQGLLFGLAHYEPSNGLGNVSVVLTIALLGVVLGYVAARTRRLGAGMVGHGLFNLVASILVLST